MSRRSSGYGTARRRFRYTPRPCRSRTLRSTPVPRRPRCCSRSCCRPARGRRLSRSRCRSRPARSIRHNASGLAFPGAGVCTAARLASHGPAGGRGRVPSGVHRSSHSARNRSRSGRTSTYTMNFHAARVLEAPFSSVFVSTGLSLLLRCGRRCARSQKANAQAAFRRRGSYEVGGRCRADVRQPASGAGVCANRAAPALP